MMEIFHKRRNRAELFQAASFGSIHTSNRRLILEWKFGPGIKKCSLNGLLLGPIFLLGPYRNKLSQPGDSSRDLFIPKRWRSQTAFPKGSGFHHPKKGSLHPSWFHDSQFMTGLVAKIPPKTAAIFGCINWSVDTKCGTLSFS